MTLLVISIAVPAVPGSEAPTMLPVMIVSLVPHFITYVTAFFILASFWGAHHRVFRMVRVVDESVLWL